MTPQPSPPIRYRWRRRAILSAWLLGGVIIVARSAMVQLVQGPYWTEQALAQHQTTLSVPARRGEILDRDGKRLLFGPDVHGPFADEFGSDIQAWRRSMNTLLGLQADILCEGHFGIYQPEEEVEKYIRNYLEMYKKK